MMMDSIISVKNAIIHGLIFYNNNNKNNLF